MPFPIASSPLIDAVAALPSLRSLGIGAQQAISGPKVFGAIEFISGTYTLAPTDRYLQINTHGVTVNLLATSNYLDNECIVIQDKTGSLNNFAVTVNPNGADHIDGVNSSFSFATDNGVLVLRKTATGWWSQVTGSSLTLTIPQYATSSLPTPDGSARLAKLTDIAKGLVFSNGTSWRPETGLDIYVIEDFGGRGDAGVTDNLPAWNAIMAVIQRNTSGYGVQSGANGAIIRFGAGVYNFTDTPKLTVPGCTVEGSGGAYGAARTLLTVSAGKIGLIVGDTNQDGGNGSGAILRNFGISGNGYLLGGATSNLNLDGWASGHNYALGDLIQPSYAVNNGVKWGGYVWKCTTPGTSGGSEPSWAIANTLSTYTETNPTQNDNTVVWTAVQGHGIVVHAGVHADNVSVSAFAGDGWHIYGDTTNSNTDLSTFINCSAANNLGNGFWTQGNDSAPSIYMMCNSLANLGYGFYDYSLEGNVYINCHTRSNGSWQWVAGASNYALNQFVGPTVPNGFLYMVTTKGTSGSTEPAWTTGIGDLITDGSTTLTCERPYSGGPYYMRNSRLITCYSEGDQQPSVLSTVSASSEGGSHGAGFVVDPNATLGYIDHSRFDRNSHAVISDNGDGHPIKTWVGAKDSGKYGWSVAKTTSGSPIAGTDLDLLFSTSNTTANGWRFQTNSGADTALVITDGTESGTTAGSAQYPIGFWIGGPQAPAGGSFISNGSHATVPGGGQQGDMTINVAGGAGIGTWHALGASTDDGGVVRWCVGTEAGAFHPVDISSTTVGSPYTVTRGDHNAVFHNSGASVKSAVNLRFADEYPYARQKFINTVSAGTRIISQHGSKIIFSGVDSGDAGYLETVDPTATVTLESISGRYFVVAHEGVWNINGTIVPYTVNLGFPSASTPTGTTQTLDWADSSTQKLSLASATGDVTLTLNNAANGQTYKLLIVQGAGGHNVVWPGSVLWNGGTAPTITGANGKTDQIILLYDGTNYFGTYFQNY